MSSKQSIAGTTKLLGVIGDPVTHSLSPAMQNAAIAALGLDYVYLPFPVKPANLQQALAGFAAIDLVGFNITIPHKRAVMPLLAEISPAAKQVGAVNTVWRTAAGWSGTNTDVTGFIAPLKAMSRDWAGATPIVIGNGGAARAVVVGLLELGCREIYVIGRNPEKLVQFQQSWADAPEVSSILKIHQREELNGLLSAADLLVNTTPVGMTPNVENSPVDATAMAKLKQGAIAYDLIYTPSPTQFLKLAKENGATAIDGLEMLVGQGAAALEIWLQRSVPVDIMRQALRAAIYE